MNQQLREELQKRAEIYAQAAKGNSDVIQVAAMAGSVNELEAVLEILDEQDEAIAQAIRLLETLVPGDRVRLENGQEWVYFDGVDVEEAFDKRENVGHWSPRFKSVCNSIEDSHFRPVVEALVRCGGAQVIKASEPQEGE